MESRKLVTSPVQEGLLKANPDDFESKTSTSDSQSGGTQVVDDLLQGDRPGQSYPISPKNAGGDSGELY